MARDTIVAAVAVIAVALGSLSFASSQPTTTTTRLQIEISGGFAYIPEPPGRINVAYLGNVFVPPDTDTNGDGTVDNFDAPVCDVKQIGTELMVIRGTISESLPANLTPANKSYNLDKAVINLPQLESANVGLVAVRTPGTPSNVTAPASWTDLRFVPSIKEFHGSSNVVPGWKGRVNGYISLKGGTFQASVPTDPLVQDAYFEFRQNGIVRGTSAVTDKVIYSVDLPGNEVRLNFSQSSVGYRSVRIAPLAPNEPVRLRLRGLHAMGSAASYADGDEIKDFCAFYSLYRKAGFVPLPPGAPTPMSSASRLKMFLVNPAPRFANGDQPSPGFFCNGDWF